MMMTSLTSRTAVFAYLAIFSLLSASASPADKATPTAAGSKADPGPGPGEAPGAAPGAAPGVATKAGPGLTAGGTAALGPPSPGGDPGAAPGAVPEAAAGSDLVPETALPLPPVQAGRPPSSSEEEDEEDWDAVEDAFSDALEAVHTFFHGPLLSLLLEDDGNLSEIRGEANEEDSNELEEEEDEDEDDDDDDDDDGWWYDWNSLMSRRRRRRRDVSQTESAGELGSTPASPEEEEEEEEEGEDEFDELLAWLILDRQAAAGKAPFLDYLRQVFLRARDRALGRRGGLVKGSVRRERLRADLVLAASRALNASQEQVSRAFGGMAFEWVGEKLFDLILGDDNDEDPNLLPQDQEVGKPRYGDDLDLSPSALAYFLVELLGTAAGLGWGAWFAATHAG